MIQIITKTNYIFHSLLYFQFNFYYVFYQLASHEKCFSRHEFMVFSVGLVIKKKPTCPWRRSGLGSSPGEKMAIHSSTLAWKIPWTEEPAGLYIVHAVTRVRPNLRIKQEQDTFSSNHLASIFPSESNTWIYFLELVIGQS